MSLFGLFYTIFGVGCKGINDIRNVMEDNDHKTRYRNSETNTYYDHKMNKRDYKECLKGDVVLQLVKHK